MTKSATSSTHLGSAGRRVVGRRLVVWGWVLVAVAVALSGVWTYSGWYDIDLWSRKTATSEFKLGVWSGVVRARLYEPFYYVSAQSIIAPLEPEWGMDWTAFDAGEYHYRGSPKTRHIDVGLWPLIAASGCVGWLLLVLARRARDRLADDQCHRCGYAMVKQQTGEHAGSFVCPECGPQAGVHAVGIKRRKAQATGKRGPVWAASAWVLIAAAALVASVWAASWWWELRVTRLPWVITARSGAVLVEEAYPDSGEENGWVWIAIPADERTFAWRSNLDGCPNGPAFWSYEHGEYWHHMVVLWPVWVGAGAVGGWMLLAWRRARYGAAGASGSSVSR